MNVTDDAIKWYLTFAKVIISVIRLQSLGRHYPYVLLKKLD